MVLIPNWTTQFYLLLFPCDPHKSLGSTIVRNKPSSMCKHKVKSLKLALPTANAKNYRIRGFKPKLKGDYRQHPGLPNRTSLVIKITKPAKPFKFHQFLLRTSHPFPLEHLEHQHHLNDQEHQVVVVHPAAVAQQEFYLLCIGYIILLMILQLWSVRV